MTDTTIKQADSKTPAGNAADKSAEKTDAAADVKKEEAKPVTK